jgi:hypothetical protein
MIYKHALAFAYYGSIDPFASPYGDYSLKWQCMVATSAAAGISTFSGTGRAAYLHQSGKAACLNRADPNSGTHAVSSTLHYLPIIDTSSAIYS